MLAGLGSSARKLGVLAVVAAVLLPALLPHLPTRFVLDGSARTTAPWAAAGSGSPRPST